ncbi:MAG TPA: glycosyltransferase family 39 protein [Candidatus Cybelea sp.]|nr:glycosyltransferase family 39 protein [Candidatus Cybelea sp.]
MRSIALILLVALALRVAYAWYDLGRIPRQILEEIGFLYEPGHIAYSLAIGRGFASPFGSASGATAWTSPVYPLILAEIFRVFGTFTFPAFVAAISLNILLSTLTSVPIYFAAKRLAGAAGPAGLPAWLWAVFPNAIVIPSEWIWDTCLSGLLAAVIVWATLAWSESRRSADWVAYGILWGLALMTNATLLAGLPFLLGWMAWRTRRTGRRWQVKPILSAAVIVLCCLPWTVRNYVALHSFIPLRSTLGLQLWLGNNDAYRERFPSWLHPIDNLAEREKYMSQGEVPYMAEKQREAMAWILAHPAREAVLFKQRFTATWLGTPHPLRDFERTSSPFLRAVLASNLLVALAALAGVVIAFARRASRPYALPLAAFPIVFPFAFYLTQALFRYRYPIDPAVLLLAAVPIAWLVPRWTPGGCEPAANGKNPPAIRHHPTGR